ncbi:hypothetical protein GINT2_000619 [Glugoides intestinalis]
MAEISLAPMLKVTTPYFRMLIRKISSTTVLFTEMIVASTVIHVTEEKLQIILGNPEDNTVVQLGGSDPEEIAKAVEILKRIGWVYFNLNCGCPSDRVQSGKFGAVLMFEPGNVSNIINCVYKMTGIVLSLKIRTGVDEKDSFEFFKGFVEHISTTSPCFKFYVHARKCWLSGLSPKQNRNIPPLTYQYVYDLKTLFPHLFISLNGGIKENGLEKIKILDGLMIGRHAWDDIRVFAAYENKSVDMKEAVKSYIEEALAFNPPKYKIVMPLINYRKGRAHTKVFKQVINKIIQSEIPNEDIYAQLEPFID